jgi:hypothetical protein
MKRFVLSRVSGSPVSDSELLDDLRRVSQLVGQRTVPQKKYRELGTFEDTTLSRRFGSWNAALRAAGLEVSNEIGLSDEVLYENLLVLWQHYGRQPRRRELAYPPSRRSQSPYLRRFGAWTVALESFVAYANAAEASAPVPADNAPAPRRTAREPSLRLRFKVLERDGFSCRKCGASPARTLGVKLHILRCGKVDIEIL